MKAAVDIMISALQEICEIAPPCSTESEVLAEACTCGRPCGWRDKLRDAQRLARVALRASSAET